MHLTSSALSASETLKLAGVPSAASEAKLIRAKPLSKALLGFDTEAEQQVQVEQTQSLSRPLLGPLETTLLAGLIATVLVRHVMRGFRDVQNKA